MTIINLTPHKIAFANGLVIEPSGTVARCSLGWNQVGDANGIPVVQAAVGDITGLPDPQPGTFYVASRIVAENAHRPDVLCPAETERSYNPDGSVSITVRSLSRI